MVSHSQRRPLLTRCLSAVALIPFTLWVIFTGQYIFSAFCILGSFICFYEFRQMALKFSHPIRIQVLGFFYIFLAGLCFYLLRSEFSFQISMVLIVLVWASDIGAFFSGKKFGGAKLAPKISPNKTWAGFYAALILPGIIAVIWCAVHDTLYPGYLADQTKMDFVLIYAFCFMTGALIGVIGQSGDLMISMLKRKAGIKDTGNLIPGHGGLLDRIDSLIPNIPVFFIIAKSVKYALS